MMEAVHGSISYSGIRRPRKRKRDPSDLQPRNRGLCYLKFPALGTTTKMGRLIDACPSRSHWADRDPGLPAAPSRVPSCSLILNAA